MSKGLEDNCKVCGRKTYRGECLFDHNEWVEIKDAPIPDMDTLMFYIEAYRSPQGHTSPQEFKKEVRKLIEKYISSREQELVEILKEYKCGEHKKLLKRLTI